MQYTCITCNVDVKMKWARIFFILTLLRTCNIGREICNRDVQYATSDVKHETWNISRQICNILHKLWNIDVKHETCEKIQEYFYFGFIQDMQHLMSNMQLWRSTCNKWRKTWNLQHFHVKYATYYVKYVILTSNMKRTRIFENILYFDFI